jgi:hypothetical protein
VSWRQITGQKPPTKPFSIEQYSAMGYPWFDYYDPKAEEIAGSKILAGLKSVKEMGEEKGESPLPDNGDTPIEKIFTIRKGVKKVREAQFD